MFMRTRPRAGFKAQQLVELVNGEEEAFHFSVLQPSLLCEDQRSSLRLEPLSGVIQPSARSADHKHPQMEAKERF